MSKGSAPTGKIWDDFASKTVTGKTSAQIFTSNKMPKGMDPKDIKLRESRDSANFPESTGIILALDVTGSMSIIPEELIMKEKLKPLIQELLERKPISDPHIMAMAVGDAYSDQAPLQVSQFEGDIRIAEQMKSLFLEGNGGGNNKESYNLPWYFAARKTELDSLEKRGKKGFLFTFGDEPCPPVLEKEHIKKIFGDNVPGDISTPDLLAMVQQKYHVFHVVVEEGDYARSRPKAVYDSWNAVMPKGHVLPLKDYTKIAEVVVSALERYAGKSVKAIEKSWGDKSTGLIVRDAIKDLVPLAEEGLVADQDQQVWRPKKSGGGRGR